MTRTFGVTKYPQPKRMQETPGLNNGVYISLDADYQDILDKIEEWFEGREEVEIVDHGTSDKTQVGFILLEWIEYEIDPAFLEILENDEDVDDYTTYTRELEEL